MNLHGCAEARPTARAAPMPELLHVVALEHLDLESELLAKRPRRLRQVWRMAHVARQVARDLCASAMPFGDGVAACGSPPRVGCDLGSAISSAMAARAAALPCVPVCARRPHRKVEVDRRRLRASGWRAGRATSSERPGTSTSASVTAASLRGAVASAFAAPLMASRNAWSPNRSRRPRLTSSTRAAATSRQIVAAASDAPGFSPRSPRLSHGRDPSLRRPRRSLRRRRWERAVGRRRRRRARRRGGAATCSGDWSFAQSVRKWPARRDSHGSRAAVSTVSSRDCRICRSP